MKIVSVGMFAERFYLGPSFSSFMAAFNNIGEKNLIFLPSMRNDCIWWNRTSLEGLQLVSQDVEEPHLYRSMQLFTLVRV